MKFKRLLACGLTVLATLFTAAKADPIGYIGPNALPQPVTQITSP